LQAAAAARIRINSNCLFKKKSEHRAGAMEFNAKRRDSDLIPLFRFQNQAALMIIEMLIDLFRMKAKIVR
jgi:hypothetical protein